MPLRSSTSLLRFAQNELLMYCDLPSFTTSRPNLCSRRPLDDSSIHLDLASGPGPSVWLAVHLRFRSPWGTTAVSLHRAASPLTVRRPVSAAAFTVSSASFDESL